MKYVTCEKIDELPGIRLKPQDTFAFRCHPGLACFTRCCRNLNLFIYPYDVVRLKNRLQISSDVFLDRHVDVVLRTGSHFPEVLLRMRDNPEHTCPFLTEAGCTVYPDRPDTCRTFPLEQGRLYDARTGRAAMVNFFRPPEFCLGQHEAQRWTAASWSRDQQAEDYHRMTALWAELRERLEQKPWGGEGSGGRRAKMAFMATYNVDRFREFIFKSSFLQRYRVKQALLRKLQTDDVQMLRFGFDWVRFFLWGAPSKRLKPR